MIRPTTPEETESLLALAESSGLFEAGELGELRATLADYPGGLSMPGSFWLVDANGDGEPVGVVYGAPEPMTEGTWNLYLIAVHPDRQREGRGAALVEHVESTLRAQGERVILIETMGTAEFEYVRAFYRNAGYREEARIRDYYRDGVDKIVFLKSLAESTD